MLHLLFHLLGLFLGIWMLMVLFGLLAGSMDEPRFALVALCLLIGIAVTLLHFH